MAQIYRRSRGVSPLEAQKLVRNTSMFQIIEAILSTKPEKTNNSNNNTIEEPARANNSNSKSSNGNCSNEKDPNKNFNNSDNISSNN